MRRERGASFREGFWPVGAGLPKELHPRREGQRTSAIQGSSKLRDCASPASIVTVDFFGGAPGISTVTR